MYMYIITRTYMYMYFQLESRVSDVSREKDDLESRIEEDQDEIEELLDKQRSHISQISSLQSQSTEANLQVQDLQETKLSLESKVVCVHVLFLYAIHVHINHTLCVQL